jgi:hypothetical protein
MRETYEVIGTFESICKPRPAIQPLEGTNPVCVEG